jgi:hypothetical protein
MGRGIPIAGQREPRQAKPGDGDAEAVGDAPAAQIAISDRRKQPDPHQQNHRLQFILRCRQSYNASIGFGVR